MATWYTPHMKIIPAIDLLSNECVRLFRGNYNKSTVYSTDPVQTAVEICTSGCSRLHIVDLDAARNRGNHNRDVIKGIRAALPGIILEVGGGIRTEKDVEELLAIGIDRLILGTVFARNPATAKKWTRQYGPLFIAGIDALEGKVKVSGWEEDSRIEDTELAKAAADNGIISIIYTNIITDGTLSGPDIDNSLRIAETSGLPVILSGGISSNDDFRRIAECNSDKIAGVITGKALYEHAVNLKRAVKLYETKTAGAVW